MEQNKGSRILKIVIIVLAVLLALSLIGLGISLFRQGRGGESSATVTENVVGNVDEIGASGGTDSPDQTGADESAAATPGQEKPYGVELSRRNEEENRPFAVTGMLPGDQAVQSYSVDVYHEKAVTVHFTCAIRQQTNRLGAVLTVRVEDAQGDLLYTGPLEELAQAGCDLSLPASPEGKDTLYYRITVTLPVTAGNAYADSDLTADWIWSVPQGGLTSPETGDPLRITLIAAAAVSAAGLILLLTLSKRKEGAENG